MKALIERLRNPKLEHGGLSAPRLNNQSTMALMYEAAAHIEALEAALQEIADMVDDDPWRIARAALDKDTPE